MIEIEDYKYHSIMIDSNGYSIFWIRGKDLLDYEVTEELAEKSRKSDKDALEVMFYLENKRWPAKDQDEADREFIRSFPEILLEHADKNKDLFSEDEFEYLLSLAKEKQKNRGPYDEDK